MPISQKFPDLLPILLLDFANSGTLDPRITFSRSSTATFCGSNKLIQTAAVGAARFDHDPVTGDKLGLLIEEQRTNAVLNGSVTGSASTATTAGTVTGPDGNPASAVIPNAGAVSYPGSGSGSLQNFPNATTAGQTTDYAFSGYFKNFGPNNYKPYLVLTAQDGASQNPQYALITFDALNGTVVDASYQGGWSQVVAPTAVLRNNMWYLTFVARYTQQATLRTNITHYFQIKNELNQVIYTADGASGVQRSCLQLELGSFPTSYIPTTTSQVTRSADAASISGTNFTSWFNQNEGTIIGEAKSVQGLNSYIAGIWGGNASNRTALNWDSSDRFFAGTRYLGTFSGSSTTAGTAPQNTYGSIAFAYQVGNNGGSWNGGTVIASSPAGLPTFSRLDIGNNNQAAGNWLNGHVKRIAYYPRRLTNTELQALSS